MSEMWKDVVGYENKYQVSNLGNVKSLERIEIRSNGRPIKIKSRTLKPTLGLNKYLIVSLGKDKKLVHRIVIEAFFGKNEIKKHVDHINSIRTDNRIENLQWVTQQENNAKQYIIFGSEHYNAVLTEYDVSHIRDEYDKIIQKRKYGAIEKIAKGYKVNNVTIHDIISRRTWKHVR